MSEFEDEKAVTPSSAWVNEQTLSSEQQSLAENFHRLIDNAELGVLIKEALENNHDMKSAALRVESMRHMYQAQSRTRFPQLQVQALRSREKSENIFTDHIEIDKQHQVNMSLAWELDLWGRLASQARAQKASWQAASWELEGARRSLVAEVIRLWLALNAQARQLELEGRRVWLFKQISEIAEERYIAGLDDHRAFIASRNFLVDARAQRSELVENYQLSQSALRLLLGRAPGEVFAASGGELPVLPQLSIKAPAWVLAHRPDVQSAWQYYLAASHQERAEHRALLPQLVFDSSLLRTGASLTALKSAPTLWRFVGGLNFVPAHVPFLAGREQRDRLQASRFDQQAQWQTYESKILHAIHEVEDLFVRDKRLQDREHLVELALAFEQQVHDDSKSRFSQGLDDATLILETELNVVTRQILQLEIKSHLIENRINLALALGLDLGLDPSLGLSMDSTSNNSSNNTSESNIPDGGADA